MAMMDPFKNSFSARDGFDGARTVTKLNKFGDSLLDPTGKEAAKKVKRDRKTRDRYAEGYAKGYAQAAMETLYAALTTEDALAGQDLLDQQALTDGAQAFSPDSLLGLPPVTDPYQQPPLGKIF